MANATQTDQALIEALLASAPKEELLSDKQVNEWLAIPKGTQAALRHQRKGWLWACTIYIGPRTPRVVKSKLIARLPELIGKAWAS